MPSELPVLPDQPEPPTIRDPVPWWWVWSAIGGGITAGSGIAALLWLTKATNHKDALDVGMKVALAIVGLLGVVLGVHRYKLSEAEHRRQLKSDEVNQRHAEALLRRQLEADQATRDDATARQITDLSSKASEQLGSDKPAVRIGGLTDLERLAQAYPELRQTVVDRVCAYLRGPFQPPVRARRNILLVEEEAIDEESSPEEIERRLELDVRRTAQQILKRHLRATDSEGKALETFWGKVTLDLRGAVLVDFELDRCSIQSADFSGCQFYGDSLFYRATFDGVARFIRAEFRGVVTFYSATFLGVVRFTRTNFMDTLTGAIFMDAAFKAPALFLGSHFQGRTDFGRSQFDTETLFQSAKFYDGISFEDVRFNDDPDFTDARVLNNGKARIFPSGWRVDPDPKDPTEGLLRRASLPPPLF